MIVIHRLICLVRFWIKHPLSGAFFVYLRKLIM
nr:MAG TPA: hypothetical protein [Bacteriophage sp.]